MTVMDLRGTTSLVTGASGGLGHAIARELASAGSHVLLHGRRRDLLEALAAETGGDVLVADLADRADLDRLIAETLHCDVVVANAGIGGQGKVTDVDPAVIDAAIDVNLRAPMLMAHHHGRAMSERGRGHLALVSSLAGKATGSGSATYSATKFGLRGFGIGLRDELAPAGVGVTVVLPGFIRDAGMFAEGGTELPGFVGTSTPEQVGSAVRGAIEGNKAEVTIAPLPVRAGANLAHLAPRVASFLSTRTPLSALNPE
jgi:short-subunit dehydrogenase